MDSYNYYTIKHKLLKGKKSTLLLFMLKSVFKMQEVNKWIKIGKPELSNISKYQVVSSLLETVSRLLEWKEFYFSPYLK